MDAQAAASLPDAAPLEIGMLLYPGMTLLDLAGPQAALGMHGRTHLFWKTLDPVMTDGGIALVPTTAFADAPARLDVLFVPGGFGTVAAMRDEEPAPPFGTGHPRTAGPELTAAALRVMGNMSEEAVGIAKARREREPA